MPWITRNNPSVKEFLPRSSDGLRSAVGFAPNDPTLYGVLEVNVEDALKYVERLRKETTEKITITHYIGKVFAEVLKLHPELNCEIRFGKFYPRTSVDLSFQVAIEDENADLTLKHRHDLSAGLVLNADQKSVIEIAVELNAAARAIRGNRDPFFQALSDSAAGFQDSF